MPEDSTGGLEVDMQQKRNGGRERERGREREEEGKKGKEMGGKRF